jgi:predicted dehydrogenase
MTITVAIIGAGGIGGAHSSAYQALPDARVTAVVDVRPEQAQKIAAIHEAKTYYSIDDFLRHEKTDMADICVPTFLHPEMAILCANHGMHVLCEKPMAPDLEKALAMVEAARRNGVFLMIAQVIRFWSEYAYLKQIYDQGTYGRLIQAWFLRLSGAPIWSWENWYLDPRRSGMAPFELHIHDTDFVHYLLGMPDQVQSVVANAPAQYASYIRTRYLYADRPEMLVESEGGWWQGPVPFEATYRVVFEGAILDYNGETLSIFEPGQDQPRIVPMDAGVSLGSAINLNNLGGIYNEIAYFTGCVRENRAPAVITPEQSLNSLKLLLTELESARLSIPLDL